MIKFFKSDTRYVHGHLNYANPVTPDPLTPMGPTVGEYPSQVWPVEISEDGRRVGFSFTAPGEETE